MRASFIAIAMVVGIATTACGGSGTKSEGSEPEAVETPSPTQPCEGWEPYLGSIAGGAPSMLDEVEQAKRYLTDPEYSSEPELAKIATEGEASIAVIPWAYSGLLAIEAAEASEGPCDELVVAKLRERLEPISDRGYKKYQEIIDAVAPLALMAESSPSLLPGLDGNFDNATPDLYPVPRDVIELGCDPVREASASQGQNLAFAC